MARTRPDRDRLHGEAEPHGAHRMAAQVLDQRAEPG
jgi:hypothetical protein